MPEFACAECGKQYHTKEFDMGGRDYCSHSCLLEGRKKTAEKVKPNNQTLRHINAGGAACF